MVIWERGLGNYLHQLQKKKKKNESGHDPGQLESINTVEWATLYLTDLFLYTSATIWHVTYYIFIYIYDLKLSVAYVL